MRPGELRELDDFSARIGADAEQVQAAGGNTSLKRDGVLWVKASGLWLADALREDVFVPVDLDAVQGGLRDDASDPVGPAVIQATNPRGLRPSIETTLHALLPHRVVVHTHSVRTIALAVRADGEAELGRRLDGLAWAWVPYRQPGPPLTRAVGAALGGSGADVLVLGNHGLVVGAESTPAAADRLAEVERRLDAPARRGPSGAAGALAAAAATLGLRPVAHERAHRLATVPWRVAAAAGGSLYPDHVVFLGPAAIVLDDHPAHALEKGAARGSHLAILPGAGLLLPADSGRAADELALCLALVLERVPEGAPLRWLSAADEAELVDWDAEKYRQALARSRGV